MSEKTSLALAVIIAEARAVETADVLAFLRSRKRAAETVARRNADERERAEIIVQSINLQIEMIEQGLHVGDAVKEAELEAGVSTSGHSPEVYPELVDGLDTNGGEA